MTAVLDQISLLDLDEIDTPDDDTATPFEKARALGYDIDREVSLRSYPLGHFPRRKDEGLLHQAIKEHFTAISKDACLPGLRCRILHELLPLELEAALRTHLGTTWRIGDALPKGADVDNYIAVVKTVRTLHPMTTFEFRATVLSSNMIDLQLRMYGQERSLYASLADYASLSDVYDQWTNIFGSASPKRSRAPRPR